MNLKALGAQTTLVSVVGDDEEGAELRAILKQQEIDVSKLSICSHRRTLCKHRVLAGNQTMLRFDQGTTAPITKDVERQVITALRDLCYDADILLISDYGYGIASDGVITSLRRHTKLNCPIAVDSKQLPRFL